MFSTRILTADFCLISSLHATNVAGPGQHLLQSSTHAIFFSWEFLNDTLYRNNPHTIEISAGVISISEHNLAEIVQNSDTDGAHIENVVSRLSLSRDCCVQ